MERLKRFYHWLYAHTHSYFWLPCPLCGKNFGGHEHTGGSIMTSWGGGEMVCPDCTEASKEYNKKWMKDNPHPGIVMNVSTWNTPTATMIYTTREVTLIKELKRIEEEKQAMKEDLVWNLPTDSFVREHELKNKRRDK